LQFSRHRFTSTKLFSIKSTISLSESLSSRKSVYQCCLFIWYGSGLVKPGQAITIESYIELKDVAAIEFMYMTYTNENGDYITNTLDGFGENNLEGISDPIVAK